MKSHKRWLALLVVLAFAVPFAAPAVANAAYGAIAVNLRTQAAGVGYGYPTKHGAQRRAEKECPGNCRKGLWVRNQCGAISVNKRGRYFGEFGPTENKAKKRARRHGRLIASVCSG